MSGCCGQNHQNSLFLAAGYVEIIAEDTHLLFHEGVNIRYLDAKAALPKKHQLYIQFTDDMAIVCTMQMYGGLYAFPEGMFDSDYYRVALEKPSPLSRILINISLKSC